jgi:hypothetical protein
VFVHSIFVSLSVLTIVKNAEIFQIVPESANAPTSLAQGQRVLFCGIYISILRLLHDPRQGQANLPLRIIRQALYREGGGRFLRVPEKQQREVQRTRPRLALLCQVLFDRPKFWNREIEANDRGQPQARILV